MALVRCRADADCTRAAAPFCHAPTHLCVDWAYLESERRPPDPEVSAPDPVVHERRRTDDPFAWDPADGRPRKIGNPPDPFTTAGRR